MKLLIIYHAGLSEDAKSIFREYARQGIELSVIVPLEFRTSTGSVLKYNSNDDEKEYRFVPLPFGAGFAPIQLFSAIKQANPDVIHVFDEFSSMYLAQTLLCRNILFGKKVPVLAYAFQNIPFASPEMLLGLSLRFFKRLAYKIIHPAILRYNRNNLDGITGCNQEALSNVRSRNSNIPAELIFWGVNTKKFSVKNRQACREKLGIPTDIKLLGYFGRIIEEKGLDKLILAASQMPSYHMLLVGDGDYREELERIAKSLGVENRIFFRQGVSQSDLVDFYNTLDMFVLPSQTRRQWKEQYGRVLVEAMACGLPVVGSSSGAIPEVLKGYPKGLIFNEESPADLAKKIIQAERLEFPGDFNLESFLHTFSIEHFAAEHIIFYKSLV